MNAHLKKQLSLDSDHDSDVNPGAPYLSSYQNQKIQSYGTMPISHSSTLQTKNSLGGREKYSNVPHMNEEENKTLLDNRNNLNDIESIRLSQSVENFDEDAKLLAGNRSLRTGRHRKKLAARSKGGEFQARRRKRRVYFCCISSEIDMQKLHEYLTGAEELFFKGWSFNIYGDVLHMFKPGVASLLPLQSENGQGDATINPPPPPLERALSTGDMSNTDCYTSETNTASNARDMQQPRRRNVGESAYSSDGEFVSPGLESLPNPNSGSRYTENPLDTQDRISAVGAQEVFVFDFGAAVCWSFSKGEEARILKVLRMFVTKGTVLGAEFENGEDDMAFICSPDVDSMTIANDMITLPENCTVKQRLSASFAIAQSTVLSIFENRIENKIEDYKYIPEVRCCLLRSKIQIYISSLCCDIDISSLWKSTIVPKAIRCNDWRSVCNQTRCKFAF